MHRQTWIAAALAVLAGWAAAAEQSVRASKAVAVVNGVSISMSELDAVVRAAGPAPVHLPAAQRRQQQLEALGLLIDNVLMRQFLQQKTNPIPPAEVDRRLNEFKAGLAAQTPAKSLAEFCHDTNQTEEQLRAGIADHLRWSSYVAANLSESAVEQYYKDNLDFFNNVTVTASHIVLRVPQAAPEKEKAEAKAKLLSWRKELVDSAGDAAARAKKFAEMAKAKSQDPRAAQGGELGTFPRRWAFDEPFSKAAFALKEGEISDVVETDFGYHLIMVTKRNEGAPSNFAKIKEVVREFCAEDLRQAILVKERKAGKIEIDLP